MNVLKVGQVSYKKGLTKSQPHAIIILSKEKEIQNKILRDGYN